jgi:hypothetical protein
MAAYFDKGKYRIRITDQSLGENRNGNPELQLRFDVIGIHTKAGVEEMNGEYPRTIYLVMTDGTIGTADKPGWVLEVLRSLNFNGQSFAQLDPSHEKAVSFVGLEIDARCDHEEYDGREREKWSIVRPNASSTLAPAKPLEKKSLRALDAKFGKVLKAVNGRPAPANDSNVATLDPPPPGRDSEEIPF